MRFVSSLVYFRWMGKHHFDWKQQQKLNLLCKFQIFSCEFPHLGIAVCSKSCLTCGWGSKAMKRKWKKGRKVTQFRSLPCWPWEVAVRKMSFAFLSSSHCYSTGVRVYPCLCLLPATYATPVDNENLRGGVLSLYFSYYLFSLSFLLEVRGKERENLPRFMLFLSCTAVCVLGYYNLVHFSCPSTKVPSYFLVPRFLWQKDDNMHAICSCFSYLEIMNSRERLTSCCCLFCGVTASVALKNRKRIWLLYRLRVWGGLLSAVSPELGKSAIFHAGSFPHKLSVPYAK